MTGKDWDNHKLHITATLVRLEAQNLQILDELSKIKLDLATHKVKSGIFGAMAASIVSLTAWLIQKVGN